MPLPESLCSTLFATVYERSTEGGLGAFAFCLLGLYFGLSDFLLGFWLFALGGFLPLNIGKRLLLWVFWYGKLLEGKRIIEGKNC
jgi:hypothetical protein